MDFSSYFPIWNKLTPTQQQILERNAVLRKVDKGTVIHNGTVECTGLLLVKADSFVPIFFPMKDGRLASIVCLIGIFACFPPPV